MENKYPGEVPITRPIECQTECGWYDDVRAERGFIDLRPYADDKTVLKNPHKGWFWHFIDNGYRCGLYRDRVQPGDHAEWFPGMNHLYLRFDWSDVEKEEGVYDFDFLDKIMEEWGPYGYRFSLRAVCYETTPGLEFATPEYVFKKGAKCYRIGGNKIQPDYSDPIFLLYLEKFMEKLGEKYNGDDRIELIDVGTYGTWGEGHTVEGDSVIYPVDTIKKHIDLHCKYFPDKFVILNDDHIAGRIAHGKECQEILDYAYERGLGLQDDSLCCDYYSVVNGYDTLRAPWAFKKLCKNAPSVMEFAHYGYIHPQFEDFYRNGLTVVESLKNTCMTYAGFHGYPDIFYKSDKWLAEYCANRLGYWYFVESAVIPELNDTAHNSVYVTVKNKGWSKAYRDHNLIFCVRGKNGGRVINTGRTVNELCSEESKTYQANLDLRGLPEGEYEICIAVFEGAGTPVRLALKDEIRKDDYYVIAHRYIKSV
ncbi:MAG: DUF4832 domain-containing protein [Clostridia bacterium]|nr:DUF4832 domain-containing protein [Clostridia bacterium]